MPPRNWRVWSCFCCSTLFIDFYINSLAPGKYEWNFRHVIFKQILVIDGWDISCEIALIWMSLDFADDQSTLVQVMAWCRQATSHYLSQCWPRSLSPYGVTRPQWVNAIVISKYVSGCYLILQRHYYYPPCVSVSPAGGCLATYGASHGSILGSYDLSGYQECLIYLFEELSLKTWWHHQIKAFSVLLALCAGNSLVTGEFPAQWPVTQSFDVFFDLRLNKGLSKHLWGWRFEMPSCSLWRHCNAHGSILGSYDLSCYQECLIHLFEELSL